MPRPSSAVHQTPSALDELLATEAGIAGRLADAERDAEALLVAARAEALMLDRRATEALAGELAELDERARLAREALVRRIEGDAERAVQRYRTLTDAEIARLAAGAVAEATGLGPVDAR